MLSYPKANILGPVASSSADAVTVPLRGVLIDPPHTRYIVKHYFSTFHEQRNQGFPDNGLPAKVPTTELICHRLADLYYPKLCLPHCIVDVFYVEKGPLKVYLPSPVTGPCFGSEWIAAGETLKTGHLFRLNGVSQEFLAYYAVFQLWLCSEDHQVIIQSRTKQPFSIDHDRYFGSEWDEQFIADKQEVKIDELFRDMFGEKTIPVDLLSDPINRLVRIPEDAIAKAFTDIPDTWLPHTDPYGFLNCLAGFTKERRQQVCEALVQWMAEKSPRS